MAAAMILISCSLADRPINSQSNLSNANYSSAPDEWFTVKVEDAAIEFPAPEHTNIVVNPNYWFVSYDLPGRTYQETKAGKYMDFFSFSISEIYWEKSINEYLPVFCNDKSNIRENDVVEYVRQKRDYDLMKVTPKCSDTLWYFIKMKNFSKPDPAPILYLIEVGNLTGREGYDLIDLILNQVNVIIPNANND